VHASRQMLRSRSKHLISRVLGVRQPNRPKRVGGGTPIAISVCRTLIDNYDVVSSPHNGA